MLTHPRAALSLRAEVATMYALDSYSEIDRRLSREIVRIRNGHFAATAKDDPYSCAAYDYVLLFLSDLSKEEDAKVASKDTGIPRGPAETRPKGQRR